MAEHIGTGKCPVCTRAVARFSLSVKNLACCTCPAPPVGCGMQTFARSNESDERLRELIAKPTPAPIPAALPADAKPASPSPPKPAPKGEGKNSWDVF